MPAITSLQAGRPAALLDLDPDLGSELSARDFADARRYAVAQTRKVERGICDPRAIGTPDLLGMLVLDGLVIRNVLVAERRCGELVTPGAILRPWDHFGTHAPMPFEVRWRVLEPLQVALLDQRLITVSARWPALMHGIIRRAVERSHALALNVAIHCLQHLELRLLVLFWHLADRCGRVTPEGVVVPLRLAHSDLAELIGGQRPSVSARLSDLAARGLVERRSDRTWLLCGDPPQEVRDMRARADAPGEDGGEPVRLR